MENISKEKKRRIYMREYARKRKAEDPVFAQKIAFHYTNLQPLWAEDNLKKGAKYA